LQIYEIRVDYLNPIEKTLDSERRYVEGLVGMLHSFQHEIVYPQEKLVLLVLTREKLNHGLVILVELDAVQLYTENFGGADDVHWEGVQVERHKV
jgi:hypothetical protein